MTNDLKWIFDQVVLDYSKMEDPKNTMVSFFKSLETGKFDYAYYDMNESDNEIRPFRGQARKSKIGEIQLVVNYMPVHTDCDMRVQLLMFQDTICDKLETERIDWSYDDE